MVGLNCGDIGSNYSRLNTAYSWTSIAKDLLGNLFS